MFGYIRIEKPELKVKEYEMYKAVYCSLCRELGRSYGLLARLTLSYDFTFLALLNIALRDGCTQIERKRCAFNPLKKCNYCKSGKEFSMPTAAAMIMLYYKLCDNIADEKGLKRLGYIFLKPLFTSAYKKAKKKYIYIDEIISEYIDEQTLLERSGCNELDKISNPTAKALSRIFMLCSEDEIQKRVLERLGYCIGRYIYILDAACDLEEDIKKASYNVLKNNYDEGKIKAQLYFCINEACAAFELLDIKKYKAILGNVLYLGLEETFKKELSDNKNGEKI